MKSNLKKNFVYNITYQILVLLIPLITMPYVSRVLGAEGVGTYSYTYSIVYYFMLFAMLGLNNYGNRTIAKVRDDKEKLSKTFKEIYLFQLITSSIMVLLYIIYIAFLNKNYIYVSIVQSLYIISCMFDINWFFFGLEKFKLTITRNIIIKLSSLVLIFLLVKDHNDVIIYTLILAGGTLLSQLALWPFVKRYTTKVKIKLKNIKKHIYPCLKLFLPVIAVAIYRVMDKTMIGLFTNVTEVGFYENAEKITNVPIAIITALGTVMLPRMSNLYTKEDKKEEVKRLIERSIIFIMFLSFGMCFGLVAVSQHFSTIFFGQEFAKTGILIIYLAVTVLFLGWGNVIRTQYLIPKEKDKIYIISAFLGAIVNFVLNIIFIPKYGSVGACIGTVVAEFIVMFYQTYMVRNELPIKEYIINTIPFFFKAFIMLIIIYPLNWIEMNGLLRLFIQVILGCLIYGLLNIKYIMSIVDIRKTINKFSKKKATI